MSLSLRAPSFRFILKDSRGPSLGFRGAQGVGFWMGTVWVDMFFFQTSNCQLALVCPKGMELINMLLYYYCTILRCLPPRIVFPFAPLVRRHASHPKSLRAMVPNHRRAKKTNDCTICSQPCHVGNMKCINHFAQCLVLECKVLQVRKGDCHEVMWTSMM